MSLVKTLNFTNYINFQNLIYENTLRNIKFPFEYYNVLHLNKGPSPTLRIVQKYDRLRFKVKRVQFFLRGPNFFNFHKSKKYFLSIFKGFKFLFLIFKGLNFFINF